MINFKLLAISLLCLLSVTSNGAWNFEAFEDSLLDQIKLLTRNGRSLKERSVQINGVDVPVNTEWLTDEQLSKVGEAGDEAAALALIRGFYEELSEPEAKNQATEKITAQCYSWLQEVTSAEERSKLDQLHMTDHAECKRLVTVYKARLPTERRTSMEAYWPFCEHVWYDHHHGHDHDAADHHDHDHHEGHEHRHRRDHHTGHERSFEGYFQTFLSWLSEEQRTELKSMKDAGQDRSNLLEKTLSFFSQLTGEAKEKARTQMQEGCKAMSKQIFGEEKTQELLQMRESGANEEEYKKKFEQFVSDLTDEGKKAMFIAYRPFCKAVFRKDESRRRRDHHTGHEAHHGEHTLEDYFRTHLTWLTDAQKEELRQMKAAGSSRAGLHKKVEQFFEALPAGEERDKAQAQLQGGCRELIKHIFGEERANELRQMRESGTPIAEIGKKVDAMIEGLTDPQKKATVDEYRPYCLKLFGVKSAAAEQQPVRRRRSNRYSSRFEEPVSDSDNTDDEPQNDGATAVAERLAQMEREGDNFELEDENLRPHNRWLSRDQKKKVKAWREEGQSEAEVHQRINEMSEDEPDGMVKTLARGILERGCESILEKLFGAEEAQEILEMRREGAAPSEVDRRITTAVQNIEDEDQRQEAGQYALTCRRILGFIMRRRRSEPEATRSILPPQHSLDNLFTTYLSWLTDSQKEELRADKAANKSSADIQSKIMTFFKATTGEKRQEAAKQMYAGCRELLGMIIGAENVAELKRLRESGSTGEQLEAKADEFIAAVQDPTKKKLSTDFDATCRAILRQAPEKASRRRRALQQEGGDGDDCD